VDPAGAARRAYRARAVSQAGRGRSPGAAPARHACATPAPAATGTTGAGTNIEAPVLTAQNSRRKGRSRWSTCSCVLSTRVKSAKSAAAPGGG
jgi:hypothetical protein